MKKKFSTEHYLFRLFLLSLYCEKEKQGENNNNEKNHRRIAVCCKHHRRQRLGGSMEWRTGLSGYKISVGI